VAASGASTRNGILFRQNSALVPINLWLQRASGILRSSARLSRCQQGWNDRKQEGGETKLSAGLAKARDQFDGQSDAKERGKT